MNIHNRYREYFVFISNVNWHSCYKSAIIENTNKLTVVLVAQL